MYSDDFINDGKVGFHGWSMPYGNYKPFAVISSNDDGVLIANSYTYMHFQGNSIRYAGTLQQTSDRDSKFDIKDIDGETSINLIKQLEPVQYRYKDNPEKFHYGLIAQDVELALCQNVISASEWAGLMTASEGGYALGYMEFIAVLMKVVKEQQVRIENLERGSKLV